jgi:hypothetical protein
VRERSGVIAAPLGTYVAMLLLRLTLVLDLLTVEYENEDGNKGTAYFFSM